MRNTKQLSMNALAQKFPTPHSRKDDQRPVAQSCTLLYRRFAIGGVSNLAEASKVSDARRIQFCATADYKSALRGCEFCGLVVSPAPSAGRQTGGLDGKTTSAANPRRPSPSLNRNLDLNPNPTLDLNRRRFLRSLFGPRAGLRLRAGLTCILVFGLCLALRLEAVQPFVKTIQPVGTGDTVRVQVMEADEDGSIFVSGSFQGTARFNSTLQLTTPDNGVPGVFLAKQDASGGWSWAKRILLGEQSEEYLVNDIDVSDTYVCVGGKNSRFQGTDRGFVALQVKASPSSDPAVKILRGGSGSEYASVSRVGLDHSNNVYVGGRFLGHVTDDTTTLDGIPPIGNAYDQDIFVFKLNSALVVQWKAKAGSSLQDLLSTTAARANGFLEDVAGLEVDAEGNVLLALNVAGFNVTNVKNRPVFLFNSDNSIAREFYTGYNGSSPSGNAFGALMAMAARLSNSGSWSVPGSLEFNNKLDRPAHSQSTVYNAPSTDMVLSGGKMYVGGTYRNTTSTHSYLMRVGVDTLLPDDPAAYLKSPTTDITEAKRVAARGNHVFLAGKMGRTLRIYSLPSPNNNLGPIDKEITSILTNEFIAGFDADLNPQWARTTTRPNDEVKPATFSGGALTYDGFRHVVFWGGHFADGARQLFLGEEENPVALGPWSTATGWLVALQDSGTYREQVRLAVNSVFGPITINNAPFPSPLADNIYLRDTTITVSVPPQVGPTADTRQRCTGFRLDGTVVSGDANTYTFQLNIDSTLTFNWRTEHRLTISSDHASAGLSDTAAAGSADPPIGISWIKEGDLVTAFIDGFVLPVDGSQTGTRFVVTGYDGLGAAGASRSFTSVAERQQVPQFTMMGPGTISYHWKRQHRVQVSTTSDNTFSLPLTRQLDANDAEISRGPGSGDFWFDHGNKIEIGARVQDSSLGRALKGWRNADPVPATFPQIEYIAPDDAIADAEQLDDYLSQQTIDGQTYWLKAIANFTQAVRVTWDYGDLIYRVNTAIGYPIDLPQNVGIAPNRAPLAVRIVDSPAGSTGNDMQIWDDVADQAYPLRPGIYFVDWDNGASGKVVTQIFSGFPKEPIPQSTQNFPGSSHYRYIADSPPEVTPAVNLEPLPDDASFFHALRYQTGNLAVADKKFSASGAGKAVLLFSKSPQEDLPAVGDLTRETLVVRVVECRVWNSATDWGGGANMVEGPATATIGAKVTSAFDTAGLGTGYLIHPNANYNADIYERERVSGPIIPVNRLVPARAENELIVVWYEKRDDILWPYQPVRYGSFDWPLPPSDSNPSEDALKRIVIASRIGSEGLDAAGNVQVIFDPARYDEVKIYNQPDRTKPGYNPNEEHARIYPSLLGNSSGISAPAAFALRDDLNISQALIEARPSLFTPDDYTSDPYVLVQLFDKEAGEAKMAVYAVEREGPATHDPRILDLPGTVNDTYVFQYKMKAGELITPPYPLNLVIGIDPCVNTVPDLYSVPTRIPNGSYFEDGNPFQRTWMVDHKGSAWAVSGGSYLSARYFYRLAPDFWYPSELDKDPATVQLGDCVSFLPAFHLGKDYAGVFDTDAHVRARPVPVRFDTVWPDNPPILKVGETLTYQGGEHTADNPEAPGLPAVIAWAAGEVVFDSMNPAMASTGPISHFNSFMARIISPLEERLVPLATADLPASLKAGSPDVRVEGDTWFFTKLSPSLQKRIFFKPLSKLNASSPTGVLGLRGFVNDRTLGASDLTAAPPPVYVLEPNVLTTTERTALQSIGSGNTAWQTAVTQLAVLSRNPSGMDQNSDQTPDDSGWLAGLEPEAIFDPNGENPVLDSTRAMPLRGLGPGLALVPNPALLDPANTLPSGYVTLAENNHPSLGAAPVTLHVIRIDRGILYRGAIKTILPSNAFDEKITLRHTADFGGNVDSVAFAWWYREEDGTVQLGDVPPGGGAQPVWNAFANADGAAGQNQIDLQNNPSLLLADNLVFVRYRHQLDLPANTARWSDWAGAANSTPRDLNGDSRPDFRAQLAVGWVKRVLDAINPFEARVRDFTRAESPATAASILQQLGGP